MSTWMLPRITDYWDCRANAVFQLAQRLEAIERGDRGPALAQISLSVERHLGVLSSANVEACAWVMVDDLYRSACNLSYWDESIPDYLKASVRPFLNHLTRRGYALRYFVDNDFEQSAIGLALPTQWLPAWFSAAGFAYVSPQEVAYRRIQSEGRRAGDWTDMLPSYLDEARSSALGALTRCRTLGSHVVFLDAESVTEAAELAFESLTPGVILAFRNTAPTVSSTCYVKIVPPVT